jgi:hypothetical protein
LTGKGIIIGPVITVELHLWCLKLVPHSTCYLSTILSLLLLKYLHLVSGQVVLKRYLSVVNQSSVCPGPSALSLSRRSCPCRMVRRSSSWLPAHATRKFGILARTMAPSTPASAFAASVSVPRHTLRSLPFASLQRYSCRLVVVARPLPFVFISFSSLSRCTSAIGLDDFVSAWFAALPRWCGVSWVPIGTCLSESESRDRDALHGNPAGRRRRASQLPFRYRNGSRVRSGCCSVLYWHSAAACATDFTANGTVT